MVHEVDLQAVFAQRPVHRVLRRLEVGQQRYAALEAREFTARDRFEAGIVEGTRGSGGDVRKCRGVEGEWNLRGQRIVFQPTVERLCVESADAPAQPVVRRRRRTLLPCDEQRCFGLLRWLRVSGGSVCLAMTVGVDGITVGEVGMTVGEAGVSARLRQLLCSQQSFDFGKRVRRPAFELRRENVEAIVTVGDGRGGHGIQCGVGYES